MCLTPEIGLTTVKEKINFQAREEKENDSN
jgi:hypothetical protein